MDFNNKLLFKFLFIVAPIILMFIIGTYDFMTTKNSYLVSLMIGLLITAIYFFVVSIFFIYWNRNKKSKKGILSKFSRMWLIPKSAEKPIDKRFKMDAGLYARHKECGNQHE